MNAMGVSPPPTEMSPRDIEVHLERRLGRRVRGLRVDVLADRIVLHGQVATYYVKQLAQHCVWDLLPEAQVVNAIVVQPSMD